MRIYDRTPSPYSTPARFADIDVTFFEHGALVHFRTAADEVLVVREKGRSYELVQRAHESCDAGRYSVDVLPVEALFAVIRHGERISFSALGAQGKTLRAFSSPDEPHSLCSGSLGDAESWKQVGRGSRLDFVSVQYAHKRLGFRVQHVTALPTASLVHLEKHYLREIHALEMELVNRAQGAEGARENRRATPQQSRQAAEVRLQLEAANRTALRWQREAEELRQEVSALKRHKEVPQAAPAAPAAASAGASPDQLATIERLMRELSVSQDRLAAAVAQRDAAAAAARAEVETALHAATEHHHRQLQVKDAEICFLLEERNRLDVTLHTIKDMTQLMRQGQNPEQRGEAAQEQGCPLPEALEQLGSADAWDAPAPAGTRAGMQPAELRRERMHGRQDTPGLARSESGEAPALANQFSQARDGMETPPSQRHPSAPAQAPPSFSPAQGGPTFSPPVHPVFNPEARGRISSLYDMLNPFRPSSIISNNSPHARELPREADMIRVSHLVGQEPAFSGASSECSDEDSVHRVAIGSTFVVDYMGTRPDAITEQAMQRILDKPLPSFETDDRHVHFNQLRANAGHVEFTVCGDRTPPTNSTRQQMGESAPTSIARTEASMDGNGRAWATGSLSLPGSASIQPLASDLDKQQCREDYANKMMTATAAVKAMENNSPPGANAVAQFMATSVPDGNWLGDRQKANRKLQLAGNDAKGVRRSAPSGVAKSGDFSQRAAFLKRPPVTESFY